VRKRTVYCDVKGDEGMCKRPAFWKCGECGRALCSKHAFASGGAGCVCGSRDLHRHENA